MNKLLKKEFTFTAIPLIYIFLAFSLMAFIPGYPILLSAFFMGLGFFQCFQTAKEENDVLYTAMLPVRKRDVVTARYLFVISLQMVFFLLSAIFTALRMTLLVNAGSYSANLMMNANLVYLAWILLELSLFNLVFLGGFWKTAYSIGKPFVFFMIWSFLLIGLAESLHHFPGLEFLNSEKEALGIQTVILLAACSLYAGLTFASLKKSQQRFEKIDL